MSAAFTRKIVRGACRRCDSGPQPLGDVHAIPPVTTGQLKMSPATLVFGRDSKLVSDGGIRYVLGLEAPLYHLSSLRIIPHE